MNITIIFSNKLLNYLIREKSRSVGNVGKSCMKRGGAFLPFFFVFVRILCFSVTNDDIILNFRYMYGYIVVLNILTMLFGAFSFVICSIQRIVDKKAIFIYGNNKFQ
jgi:hypothetical protein